MSLGRVLLEVFGSPAQLEHERYGALSLVAAEVFGSPAQLEHERYGSAALAEAEVYGRARARDRRDRRPGRDRAAAARSRPP